MAKTTPTAQRKDQHLELCLDRNVASAPSGDGWDSVHLPHRALPNLNFDTLSLETEFLGHKYRAPILISSMTGGTAKSDRINERLAKFAQTKNIPLGLGSQRILIESPEKLKKFALRKLAPKLKLFANIGAVQLNYGVSVDQIQRLVEETHASGLFVHLNALQEAIQKEGDRNFSGLESKLAGLRRQIKAPLILKETGSGLDVETARRARDLGFDAVDISGMGGTHWGYIEGLRHSSRRKLGDLFRGWGIPSPQALVEIRQALGPTYPIIASGGLRSGLDIGRACYLGADFCGLALPFLQAAQKGDRALEDFYAFLEEALRVTLFCTGNSTPKELKAHGTIGKV